jgi:siroheme synthase-like protein
MIGGGKVGMRKLPDLLAAGARVNLVDPAPLPQLPQHPRLTHFKHSYHLPDLSGARLVFALTADPLVNAGIAADAAAAGVFCCRADNGAESDFISPARLSRPPLSLSISSGGESPALAAIFCRYLNDLVPGSWQTAAHLAGLVRRKVLTDRLPIPYNQQVLLKLMDEGLLAHIERADHAALDQLLLKHFGAGFSLKDLHFQTSEGTS